MDKISNPHDKLFRETWSNKEAARDFLKSYLPGDLLDLINLDTLEITKDSFIEQRLEDFYSDLLYKVVLDDQPGFIYLLFEHKSYKDSFVHLQLLEYMLKIWQLHLKQTQTKRLPIIIPLVLYHGRTSWDLLPKLSSLISGPCDKLAPYIPDFEFILYDLTRFSDEEIRGTIFSRVVLLLLKHITDKDLSQKLPRILALLDELIKQDNGLRFLETVLRYLFSTADNITKEEMQSIMEQSLSDIKGDFIMTLAEQWENEGFKKGLQQGLQQGIQQGMQKGMQQGVRDGLTEGIELALILKFGNVPDNQRMLEMIKNITDVARLKAIKSAIIEAKSIPDLISRL